MMKQNTLLLLLLPLLLVMLSGCSSTRTYQKVNHIIYPQNKLPETTGKIKILHTLPVKEKKYTNNQNSGHYSRDRTLEEPSPFGTKGKQGYIIDQAARALRQGQFYQIEKKELSPNDIKSWSSKSPDDYLLSDQEVLLVLENLNSDYDFTSEKIRKHQLDASGNDYYIDAWEANRYYKVLTNWKVYHGSPAKVIYQFTDDGQRKVSTQGLQKDQTIQKLDSLAEGTERFLLDSLAGELSRKIMPRKVFDSWSYYVKGSDELEEGEKYMKLDKLEEAQELYRAGLRPPNDPKVEARLHYNLAVIQDILGHLDQALLLAEKALLTEDKYLHQKLYDDLKLKKEIRERS